MAEDKSFKELIAEQKQTNKLLLQQMASEDKGAKLGASIKNAAGEIINDQLIGRTARKEADETQAVIKKGTEETLEQGEKNQKDNLKIFKTMSTALTGAFVNKKTGGARGKEKFKDTIAMFSAFGKKYFGKSSFLYKGIMDLRGYLGGLFKSLLGKGKGILGFLATAIGYGLLLKYLNSEGFKEFIKGDAPKKIAEMARKIFGKDGALDRTTFHLGEIIKGFTDPDKSGFAALGAALTELREAIFGKSEKKEGEEDGSILGGLSTFNKALLAVGLLITAKLLLPSALFKGVMILSGIAAIGYAIQNLNEFLGLSARSLDEETGLRDNPALETILPVTKGQSRRIFKNRIYGSNKYVPSEKTGKMKIRGLDGKATVLNAPSDNAGKGNAAQKAMKFFEKAPNWLKKTFGTLVKRFPIIGQALIARDSYDILTNDMPWDANPDKPSKGKSLMSLIGNVGGMTLGGIAGSFIPLPVLGTLAGMGIGSFFGGDLGVAAYKALWLQNKGVDVMSTEFLRAMFTDTMKGSIAGKPFANMSFFSGDETMTPNEKTFGLLGKGFDYIKTRGNEPTRLAKLNESRINNPGFVAPQLAAETDLEYLQKLGITNPVIINNVNNNTSGPMENLGNGMTKIVTGSETYRRISGMIPSYGGSN
jgi:hypothetical protein